MFPAMVIVPTMQIAWTLFSIMSGMLYFQVGLPHSRGDRAAASKRSLSASCRCAESAVVSSTA